MPSARLGKARPPVLDVRISGGSHAHVGQDLVAMARARDVDRAPRSAPPAPGPQRARRGSPASDDPSSVPRDPAGIVAPARLSSVGARSALETGAADRAPRQHPGARDHQRDPQRLLIRLVLTALDAVLAGHHALVGEEHQHRVIALAAGVEGGDDLRDAVVERGKRREAAAIVATDQLAVGARERRAPPHRLRLIGDVGLVERGRVRDRARVKSCSRSAAGGIAL